MALNALRRIGCVEYLLGDGLPPHKLLALWPAAAEAKLKEVRMLASLPDGILVRLLGEIDEALGGDVDPIPAPIARATRLLQEYLLLRRA